MLTVTRRVPDESNRNAQGGGLSLGPIRLEPGVLYRHALVGLYASFTTISMVVFINLIQPSLLINVIGIPLSEVGSATGRLGATHEIVAIIAMSLIGVLSDQRGRRVMYVAGFVIIGLGYFVYPLADSLTQLIIFRMIFAIGSATIMTMMTTVAIDYSHQTSRGKWLGLSNVVSAVGVMATMIVMSRVPVWLEGEGFDGAKISQYVFWLAAATCFFSALILGLGLKGKQPNASAAKDNPLTAALAVLKSGLRDRKLCLTYGASFIGRGDMAIIGMFLPLWVTSAALEAGSTMGEATMRAGTLLVVHQAAVVISAVFAGMLNDRFSKVSVLAFAFITASVGYFTLWAIDDPFSSFSLIGIVILAAGEISIIITTIAIAGDQAPQASRGAVIGLIGVFGGIGIAIATFLGGELFDAVSPATPFAMMVVLNMVIIVWALVVREKNQTQI